MTSAEKELSTYLKAIAPPQRLKIILAIGQDEVCVCHLEATFPQWRQAYISQHLMALREADVLTSRREGRYVYYRLRNALLLDLLSDMARLSGLSLSGFQTRANCECPSCAVNDIPEISVVTR